MNPIFIIKRSLVKKQSPLTQERDQIKDRLQAKQYKQSQTNIAVDLDVRGKLGMDFFTGGMNVIMDYGLVFWPEVLV